MSFVVPSAVLAVRRLAKSGLIADRQYTPSLTVASGRNFTTACVVACGGPGVAIDPLQISSALTIAQMTAQRRISEERL
jgi:hypothetical protein